MARIRSIKPEFFTSLAIASLPERARLLFIGLWTYVDDAGRGVLDGRLVKAAVFPLDERITVRVIEELLELLAAAGRINPYTVCGRRYFTIVGWSEHQRINRASPSKLPDPPLEVEPSPHPHGGLTEPTVDSHGTLTDGSLPRVRGRAPAEQGAGSREQGAGNGTGSKELRLKASAAAENLSSTPPTAAAPAEVPA